ncbi:MAG: DUF2760 domain-containing protein [Caldilineaceae bacterium]
MRPIHEGCKQALAETMTLEPVAADAAEAAPSSRPASTQRLCASPATSAASAFTGTVQHRGWRVKSIDLPKRTKRDAGAMVVAALRKSKWGENSRVKIEDWVDDRPCRLTRSGRRPNLQSSFLNLAVFRRF